MNQEEKELVENGVYKIVSMEEYNRLNYMRDEIANLFGVELRESYQYSSYIRLLTKEDYTTERIKELETNVLKLMTELDKRHKDHMDIFSKLPKWVKYVWNIKDFIYH